jgi:minor extracellular serine protease Vpr
MVANIIRLRCFTGNSNGRRAIQSDMFSRFRTCSVSGFAHAFLFLMIFAIWMGPLAMAQRTTRYALILEDDPVSVRFASREGLQTQAAANYRSQIEARHEDLKRELGSRNFTITGSVTTVANAVFVIAPASRVAELRGLPGVKGVTPLRSYRRKLNQALPLLDASGAWNALGGMQNAGAGMKIAFIDGGIDPTHAAFQDPSLSIPAGFPKCTTGDCVFTNNKVIVARSYVKLLAAGSNPQNPAVDSRPDDVTARDHDGHGTAVAAAAAATTTTTGLVPFNGMAPKAFVGSYKVFGSPGVNDETTDDVLGQALDDAIADGMDVISVSLGGEAFTGPLDTGAACGLPTGTPCDMFATMIENASLAGAIIVCAAGNDGFNGFFYPAFNSIDTPGDAPDAIAVGASTNAHFFNETVSVPGNVASSLKGISGQTGDANTFYPGALTLPLLDITQVGDPGSACNFSSTSNALYGYFVLVERSSACDYATQVENVENSGAFGVIIYMNTGGQPIAPNDPFDDPNVVPFIVVSNANGVALKAYVDANPLALVTIDSAGMEQIDTADANELAGFSSVGPSTGSSLIKPDLVAVGTNVYSAAETYDISGDVYSSTGFAAASGTSLATPLVSGAAAMVKQKHPTWTAAQVKSALVNTVAEAVQTDDASSGTFLPVDIQSFGAGLLDAGAAVNASVTVSPTTLSFGILASLPQTKPIQITNTGSAAVTLAVSNLASNGMLGGAAIGFDKTSVTLAAGASATVNVTLSGAIPAPSEYSALVQLQGNGVSLRVPYMYFVPDNQPGNLLALGGNFDGLTGSAQAPQNLAVKLVDDTGVPISGAAVTFTAPDGGQIQSAQATTDNYGIAIATPVLGSQAGQQYTYNVDAGGMELQFFGFARSQPVITSVENAGSFSAAAPVAPGSYIVLIGTNLCDFTDQTIAARLPLQIDQAFVSFDVPSAGISVPGHLSYASPTQVNLQVPWELAGQTSAQIKVSINFTYGAVFTIPIAAYSPAFFEIAPGEAAAEDSNYNVLTPTNPAKRGSTILLYANGLGPVSNTPPSGDPSPASPLAQTTTTPVVNFGTTAGTVVFSGMTPGVAGLYQMNVTVPTTIAPGTYPLTVLIGGVTSKASGIVVQ